MGADMRAPGAPCVAALLFPRRCPLRGQIAAPPPALPGGVALAENSMALG
jgi:hypothetical protein